MSIRVTGGYGLRSFPGTTTLVVMAGQAESGSDIGQYELCRLLRLGMVAAHAYELVILEIDGRI